MRRSRREQRAQERRVAAGDNTPGAATDDSRLRAPAPSGSPRPRASLADWIQVALGSVTLLLIVWGSRVAWRTLQEMQAQTAVIATEQQHTQRPWVLVKTVTPGNIGEGQRPTIRVDFQNYGQTPGLDVTVRHRILFLETPEPPGNTMPLSDQSGPSVSVIGPGANSFSGLVTRPTAFTPEEWTAFTERRGFLVVVGRMRYADPWKKAHETEYCYGFAFGSNASMLCSKWNTAN